MSRAAKVDHEPIAAAIRQTPEVWRMVRAYPTRAAALSTARYIRAGQWSAYLPAGSFDAEVRRDADGEHVVWAQYLGDPEAAALERARRIAVQLEQELARLREVAATLADRWDEHATFLSPMGPDRDPEGPAEQTRLGRAHGYQTAAKDLRWILANGTIPHDLMTNEELGEPSTEPSDGAS